MCSCRPQHAVACHASMRQLCEPSKIFEGINVSLTETELKTQSKHAGEQVLEAILSRRSVGRVKPDELPWEVVERILQAAVHAPNHYRTEPWRFFVLRGRAREELGDVMASSLRERLQGSKSGEMMLLLEKERAKPLRAPVIIAVAAVPSPEPHVLEIEEVAAAAA